jgi:hypothetical protein
LQVAGTFDSAWAWPGFDAVGAANPGRPLRAYAFHATLDLAVFALGPGGGAPIALSSEVPEAVRLAGYAFPYADGRARLTVGEGPVTDAGAALLRYRISTLPGDSGGPVFSQGTAGWAAHAVHTDGATDVAAGNGGVRLTTAVQADLPALIAFARSQLT